MSQNIESMPILPIAQMAKDAQATLEAVGDSPDANSVVGDLACHVLALVAELEKAAEACALAHNHLDTYGIVNVEDDDREKMSQERVFEAVGPFTRAVGHKFVSVY
jgi:hypothetical protein